MSLESAGMVKTTPKTTSRTKKPTTVAQGDNVASLTVQSVPKDDQSLLDVFNDLADKICDAQEEFERLQREIAQVRQNWEQEQKSHQLQLAQQDQQEQLDRRREKEAYEYSITRSRKETEDELADYKATWKKELAVQKEAIEKDKQDLVTLRGQASAFESEKTKAIDEALTILQKQLSEKFGGEAKLREQEAKAEKEVLKLKVANLIDQNSRQSSEIESLKKAFDEATRQVKEIAVKVIESGGNLAKASIAGEI